MYTIGYDIGSSSIKAALVETATGKSITVVNEPEVEMEMVALKNGWAEQDPDEWWKHVCNATKQLIKAHSISSDAITGIGISYQMHGLVIVDDNGEPLRQSIIWCDSRAVEIGQKAFEDLGPEKCAERLLNSPANFTASKLKWVKENEPDLFDRIDKFMLPGDYIAYKLGGTICSTISGLSEGIFWDFKSNSIATWLLDHYGITEKLVPDFVDTFSVQGKVSEKGASESGLAVGTPILYRAGDQPNNALSLNVFNPGEVAATGGTSGVMYAITDSLSVAESARVNNFAHVNYTLANTRIGKMACINGAGIMYRWLMKNLDVSSYEEMNALASSVPIGSDGVTIHPFGNGAERVLNNKTLGTRMSNINLNNHDKAHLCRAALEGIAFSFVYGMEIMKSDGIEPSVIRAGNDNLFRSDIFSSTIATLIEQEIEIYNTTGAIGAARACELHKGDFDAFGKQIMDNDYEMGFRPSEDSEVYQKAYSKWKKELEILLEKK
ncbi:carbohydrate kinase [Aggregatimonas sangjinii]|uniref:Carbohydrate kinase n=1 Tax=Aggregatimonas sangjinii TaxID=2583587 RepID=A0A5B7SJB0_9FLAO|nr:FGGY family carbohydrate kinase [Aggregatimonas sangjinii]QCW98635.1 carbohydrate kinase [Aggregatimonas sangjinii]